MRGVFAFGVLCNRPPDPRRSVKHILVAGISAAMLLLEIPHTSKQAIVDYILNLGSVTAIAEYIDRNRPKE